MAQFRYYVQFYAKSLDGTLVEACGSDGVFILDGRNKLQVMKLDAQKQMHRLTKVRTYEYFEIRKCYRLSDTEYTSLYKNFEYDKDGVLFRRF